jgi:hypothetical protein
MRSYLISYTTKDNKMGQAIWLGATRYAAMRSFAANHRSLQIANMTAQEREV